MEGMDGVVQRKTANISEKILAGLEKAYKTKPSPEDIMHYIYGLLYSTEYRQTYVDFLKTEYPRIPFTSDYALFRQMAELGKRLKDLHLMTSDELNEPVVRYQGQGEDIVKFRRYNEDENDSTSTKTNTLRISSQRMGVSDRGLPGAG